jgi:hypothetical protein
LAGRKDTVAMVAIYVFSDEAGNFDFSGKTGASAFFVLCTVSAAHCQYGDQPYH